MLLSYGSTTTEFVHGKNEVTWNERFDIGVRAHKNGKNVMYNIMAYRKLTYPLRIFFALSCRLRTTQGKLRKSLVK